jgi:hypothetical protein
VLELEDADPVDVDAMLLVSELVPPADAVAWTPID